MFQRFDTELSGVFLLQPRIHRDARGFFSETYHLQEFANLGIPVNFVQDNHSSSSRNSLRGLHYQLHRPQAKLCRVVLGEVFDVAVDVRHGSPTFGRWVGYVLSAEKMNQIFIPVGFAHGFSVMSERAEFLYKCSDFYDPSSEVGIAWNDPDLAIDWRIDQPLLSQKDSNYPTLRSLTPEMLPPYAE